MENEKKIVWLPDKKKDLNRRKGNNDSSYYFPFIFYIKKHTKSIVYQTKKTKMQEKNTHVQLINKSEKHISSKKF